MSELPFHQKTPLPARHSNKLEIQRTLQRRQGLPSDNLPMNLEIHDTVVALPQVHLCSSLQANLYEEAYDAYICSRVRCERLFRNNVWQHVPFWNNYKSLCRRICNMRSLRLFCLKKLQSRKSCEAEQREQIPFLLTNTAFNGGRDRSFRSKSRWFFCE